MHNPCFRGKALAVLRIKGIVDATRLVRTQVNNVSGKIEGLIPAPDIEHAGGGAGALS
jgi:predicted alternative tryptophan synthase beta-subunit